jgi:hypothetical protein
VNESQAQLLLPAPQYFPHGSVLHELLHIRRFLLDGVAQLTVCDNYWEPELARGFTDLDNNLEHLVIVPEELEKCPERRDRWNAATRRVLDKAQSNKTSQFDRECLTLLSWVFIQRVLQGCDISERARVVIQDLGLNDRAARMLDAIVPYLQPSQYGPIHAKERISRICIEHLRLPMHLACLQYFDSRQRKRHQVPFTLATT